MLYSVLSHFINLFSFSHCYCFYFGQVNMEKFPKVTTDNLYKSIKTNQLFRGNESFLKSTTSLLFPFTKKIKQKILQMFFERPKPLMSDKIFFFFCSSKMRHQNIFNHKSQSLLYQFRSFKTI